MSHARRSGGKGTVKGSDRRLNRGAAGSALRFEVKPGSRRLDMNISIIGDGNVGSALARGLERGGHQVETCGHDREREKQLAESGEVIILAVPFAAVDEVATTIGHRADGKTVVDVTNALTPDHKLAVGFTTSGAEELQKKLPRAHVVKAFNTDFARTMDSGEAKGEQLTAFIAADDSRAKKTVIHLAEDIGFDAVDAGPLDSARLLEPLALLNIRLGYDLGLGQDSGIKVIH
jgi:8-hydroxy-5-deazaflavin:NADPH oxidoreductase